MKNASAAHAVAARTAYDRQFYSDHVTESQRSAFIVLSEVWKIFQPRSVVDVGCGLGAWLAAAQTLGAIEIAGYDGPYVARDQLLIPPSSFQSVNLCDGIPTDKRYDLAISLEVAEHLPAHQAAHFVKTLASLSDIILFSAAIPFQGGTAHCNENWPEYWAGLFAGHGYVAIDALRESVWTNSEVSFWYRQNVLIFATPDAATRVTGLAPAQQHQLTKIHPEMYLWACRRPYDTCGRPMPGNHDLDVAYFRQVASDYRSGFVSDADVMSYGNEFDVRSIALPFAARATRSVCRFIIGMVDRISGLK